MRGNGDPFTGGALGGASTKGGYHDAREGRGAVRALLDYLGRLPFKGGDHDGDCFGAAVGASIPDRNLRARGGLGLERGAWQREIGPRGGAVMRSCGPCRLPPAALASVRLAHCHSTLFRNRPLQSGENLSKLSSRFQKWRTMGEYRKSSVVRGILRQLFQAYALCFRLCNEIRSISHEVLTGSRKGRNKIR